MEELDKKPPLFKFWSTWYVLVIVILFLLIVFFYYLTKKYS